jgi:hypothetical protein
METTHESRTDTQLALQMIGNCYKEGEITREMLIREANWLFDDKGEMTKYLSNLGINLEA